MKTIAFFCAAIALSFTMKMDRKTLNSPLLERISWHHGALPPDVANAPIGKGYENYPRFLVDINKDGLTDYGCVVGNAENEQFLSFSLKRRDGGWDEGVYNSKPGYGRGYLQPEPYLADVNGDGFYDYVRRVGNQDTYWSALLGTKTGLNGQDVRHEDHDDELDQVAEDIKWLWGERSDPAKMKCIFESLNSSSTVRGNVSAHQCVVNAIVCQRNGDNDGAISWLRAGQCHNGDAQEKIGRRASFSLKYIKEKYDSEVSSNAQIVSGTTQVKAIKNLLDKL